MKRLLVVTCAALLSACNLNGIGDPCTAFGSAPTWRADRFAVKPPEPVTFTVEGTARTLCGEEPRPLTGAQVYADGRLVAEGPAQGGTVTLRWTPQAGQNGLPASGEASVKITVTGLLVRGTTPVVPTDARQDTIRVSLP